MTELGQGDCSYTVNGENWGSIPDGWSYKDATSVDVDADDNAYVFNRGNHPVIVFDRDGNVLRTWGGGVFTNAPGRRRVTALSDRPSRTTRTCTRTGRTKTVQEG